MAKINACGKCGRRGVDRCAVLPSSATPVCLDCYKGAVGSIPLPSPPPSSPVPVPYPNVSGTGQFAGAQTKRVTVRGKEVAVGTSSVAMSQGDEAGTLKGVKSLQAAGAAWRLPAPSVTIHSEGSALSVYQAGKKRK